ncbi:MAG: hypothetical protein QFF03_14585 [Pseudomonadota bacterium]|nr:hypothetical protein [Pseudomonadota bacterium]
MMRAAVLLALALAGCAIAPAAPPGTVLADAGAAQAIAPGLTTRAMLLARYGATTMVRFDSGVEVWRYLTPAAGGAYGELVIVLDPRGIVAQLRRAPAVYPWPPKK